MVCGDRKTKRLKWDRESFDDFKATYNKRFSTKEAESVSFENFRNNLDTIDELDKTDGDVRFTVNMFADYGTEEFKLLHGCQEPPRFDDYEGGLDQETIEAAALVIGVDWRLKGAVHAPRHQGKCSSGWAMAAIGNFEGQHFVRTSEAVRFSAQPLLDCSPKENRDRCSKGNLGEAFHFFAGHGLVKEGDMPYTAGYTTPNGHCRIELKGEREPWDPPIEGKLPRFTKGLNPMSLPKDESLMAAFVASKGPLAVAVDARLWPFYNGGIMHLNPPEPLEFNHAVLLVGWGVGENDIPYWIVKNSWGVTWGESGYMRLLRGNNTCGVAEFATTSTVDDFEDCYTGAVRYEPKWPARKRKEEEEAEKNPDGLREPDEDGWTDLGEHEGKHIQSKMTDEEYLNRKGNAPKPLFPRPHLDKIRKEREEKARAEWEAKKARRRKPKGHHDEF